MWWLEAEYSGKSVAKPNQSAYAAKLLANLTKNYPSLQSRPSAVLPRLFV